MPVGRLSAKELEAFLASPDMGVDHGPKSPKKYERAFTRCEPHHAHKADIADLADEIADRWFKRAVRFGDELRELNLLFALTDLRP